MYNSGKHPVRGGLHNPGVVSKTHRWVGEITVGYKRFRFRSTNLRNVEAWVRMMVEKYPAAETGRRNIKV